ncbi:Hypothetical protein SMAX5B_012646 [Scophthalmus maximus]|uniref:Uncharacterized protein n=1 Tax=Scophthalmus maximus TaxID=52904 RepID=A0A2U9BCI8_SCOMX|nr:Hypothetical protein SMAX5B_012646 [Scophthalmus maximus]
MQYPPTADVNLRGRVRRLLTVYVQNCMFQPVKMVSSFRSDKPVNSCMHRTVALATADHSAD